LKQFNGKKGFNHDKDDGDITKQQRADSQNERANTRRDPEGSKGVSVQQKRPSRFGQEQGNSKEDDNEEVDSVKSKLFQFVGGPLAKKDPQVDNAINETDVHDNNEVNNDEFEKYVNNGSIRIHNGADSRNESTTS